MAEQTTGSAFQVALIVGTTRIVSANPYRHALIISLGPTGSQYFVSNNPNMAWGDGLAIHPFHPVVQLCKCHVGDWITQALYAVAQANTEASIVDITRLVVD